MIKITLRLSAFVPGTFILSIFLFSGAALDARELPESTAVAFATGDIFVAATVMDDPDDDHAGTGRILQYDANLQLKGTLWVEGTRHKIGGLTFDRDGVLWGFAQLTPAILQFKIGRAHV